MRIELTLEDIASTWIKRQSQIEFLRVGSNPDSIIRLSGRPGYQIGKPIRLVDFISELSSLSDSDVYEMEIMSHSSCSNAAIRSKTQFEKDQFVSCYIDFNMAGGDCSGTFLEFNSSSNYHGIKSRRVKKLLKILLTVLLESIGVVMVLLLANGAILLAAQGRQHVKQNGQTCSKQVHLMHVLDSV